MKQIQPSANVRTATTDDAEAACVAVRRSIVEICGPDYGHEELVIRRRIISGSGLKRLMPIQWLLYLQSVMLLVSLG